MNEPNNSNLAIGYGRDFGMVLTGIFFSAGYIISNYFNINIAFFVTIVIILISGLAIALYSAQKMDNNVISNSGGQSG